MECTRCHGVMVPEVFEDLHDDTGVLAFQGWRCLLCGEIIDPVIAAHRQGRPTPVLRRARTRVATALG